MHFFLLLSCAQQKEKTKPDSERARQVRSVPVTGSGQENADTENSDIINRKLIVLYTPDSLDAELLREKMGEDDFNIVADDNAFYTASDIEFLKAHNVEILSDVRRDYKFRLSGGVFVIKKSRLENYWGGILFNGKDTPVVFSGQELEGKFNNKWK